MTTKEHCQNTGDKQLPARRSAKIRKESTLEKGQVYHFCDGTMVRCMKEAALGFEVKEEEEQDWMSTYLHVMREAINAQHNHCCQELWKTLYSKYYSVTRKTTGCHHHLTKCCDCLQQNQKMKSMPNMLTTSLCMQT
jgi:hypothetical protein